MKIRYLLNGVSCNPVKREDIYLEINHDQGAIINQDYPNVGIRNLYFGREDLLQIMGWLNQAPGITEGIPFDIEITENGQIQTINFFLNFMDGFKRSKDGMEASIKMVNSLDWLDNRVQAFTPESLYNDTSLGSVNIDGINYSSYQEFMDKRCIYIPYVISTVPDSVTAFTATFALIGMSINLYGAIKNLTQWATPIPGAILVVGVVQLILEIAYTVLLVASIVVLITELVNALIQPLKYHGAMLVVDTLKMIANKVGLTLQSSIWETYPYNQVAYLPEKFNPLEGANPSHNVFGNVINGFAKRGFTSPGYATNAGHSSITPQIQKGYFNGIAGDFLRLVKTFCNGKFIVPDATTDLLVERRDYYPPSTLYQMQDVRQDWNGYNTDELEANLILRFRDDLNDKNIIDFKNAAGQPFYPGTILQAITSQGVTNDKLKVTLTGLRTIQVNAARGAAKDQLNFIEKTVAFIDNILNTIVTAFNTTINALIDVLNAIIAVINVMISILNALFAIVTAIINVIAGIINAISWLFGGSGVGYWSGFTIGNVNTVNHINIAQPYPNAFTNRLGALLLENDMVTTPKLLMVDTTRSDFTNSGGYSGQQRIAYLHPNNQSLIHCQQLWNDFYHIDAFVGNTAGPQNNRFTKITPALNHPTEGNPVTIRLADFKNLVNNPKFKDNYNEDVYSESIQWYLEKNGRSILNFRKPGWLADPQNPNGVKRAQEIFINLKLDVSLPNGQ